MPSVKNPNGPSKNRLSARLAKARKTSAQQVARKERVQAGKITKADAARGAGGGLLPTSGPNAAKGAKAQRKLDRKMKHALKRRMEAEGEIEMKDVIDTKDAGAKKQQKESTEEMAVDTDNIS